MSVLTDAATQPTYLHVPDGVVGNYGDEVADVAALMGRPLDGSQRIAVDAKTSYKAGGDWAALETVTKAGRQSGKTGGIETPTVMTDLFVWPPDRIVWTAHLFKTCREAFEDHLRLIQATPEFDRRVAKVQQANGEESIILKSGARLDYLARSKGSGRGLGGKRVVVDETLFFTGEQAGALLPVLAARKNTQIDYLSSAARGESDYLRSLTARGRAGGDPSLVLVEFCAPGSWARPGCRRGVKCPHVVGTDGCSLDDRRRWILANPGVAAGRVDLEFLAAMRRSLDPVEFGREFLGWDEAPSGNSQTPITAGDWGKNGDPVSAFDGRPVFAIAVSRDSKSAAISVAGWRADGLPHVETVDRRLGDGWVAERAGELRAKWRPKAWAIDVKTAAAALRPDLKKNRVRPVEMNTTDVAAGCASFQSRVQRGELRHRGDNDPELRDAVHGAGRRDIGPGMWAWSAKSSEVDIVALESATLALRLLEQTPRTAVPVDAR